MPAAEKATASSQKSVDECLQLSIHAPRLPRCPGPRHTGARHALLHRVRPADEHHPDRCGPRRRSCRHPRPHRAHPLRRLRSHPFNRYMSLVRLCSAVSEPIVRGLLAHRL